RICTGSRFWLNVVVRTFTRPCAGRDFDGRTARISLSRWSSSPGRTGRGQRNSSKPAPRMPSAVALHQQPHRQGGGMPAARRETAENRVLRCLLVEMEGLRIELGGEVFDPLCIDAQSSGGECLAYSEVFEV